MSTRDYRIPAGFVSYFMLGGVADAYTTVMSEWTRAVAKSERDYVDSLSQTLAALRRTCWEMARVHVDTLSAANAKTDEELRARRAVLIGRLAQFRQRFPHGFRQPAHYTIDELRAIALVLRLRARVAQTWPAQEGK